MGRTIPAWRMVVEAELERMKKFQDFLRKEDQIIFEDMMNQCKLYASYASTMASPIKEVPLMMSILFAHHKMLWEHEKYLARTKTLGTLKAKPKPDDETTTEQLSAPSSITIPNTESFPES
jgi:hypothetical protein